MPTGERRKLSGTPGCALLLCLAAVLLLGAAAAVLAQSPDPSYGLNTTASAAQFKISSNAQADLNRIVGTIIKTILGLTGVIFMILLVGAGDLWMTANGNEEKIKKARDTLFNAAIGLLITFAAYLGTDFLVSVALEAVGAS
jgi:hypothetical protein